MRIKFERYGEIRDIYLPKVRRACLQAIPFNTGVAAQRSKTNCRDAAASRAWQLSCCPDILLLLLMICLAGLLHWKVSSIRRLHHHHVGARVMRVCVRVPPASATAAAAAAAAGQV